jgi:cell division protein ZapA
VGQVSVTLNDRIYRLVCDDGEEDRLVELATYVKAKVGRLTEEIGNPGQERLMLMAALIIADELWDARAELATLMADASSAVAADPEPVRRLKSLASKLAQDASPEAVVAAGDGVPAPGKTRKRDVA